VAEGVETRAQFERLSQEGCEAMQGFLLRPAHVTGRLRRPAARGNVLPVKYGNQQLAARPAVVLPLLRLRPPASDNIRTQKW